MTKAQEITEEMGVHKQWFEDAKKQTLETLPAFLAHLMNDYEHDYGTVCHAITAGAVATAWAMNRQPQGGITGAQAGFIMWGFLQQWMDKKGPMRLVSYEDMLYPQCGRDFTNTISPQIWEFLQAQAREKLATQERAHPNVRAHWESIVAGTVPFEYSLGGENS